MKLFNSVRLGLVAGAMMLASTLSAAPVSFSTNGIFSQSGTSTANFGGLTLSFTGVNSTVDPAPFPFTFTSFGTITASTASTTPIATSGNFTLNIVQTVPGGGNSSLTGTLSGSVDVNTSTGLLTITSGTTTIGGVQYSFAQTSYSITPPTGGSNGQTTLQGRVDVSAIPEPSTYALLSSGILAMVGLSRRIRKS